jgi:hypothetical protein
MGGQEKTHLFGWKFSCFSAQLFEQDLFWPAAPRDIGFLYQRFSMGRV